MEVFLGGENCREVLDRVVDVDVAHVQRGEPEPGDAVDTWLPRRAWSRGVITSSPSQRSSSSRRNRSVSDSDAARTSAMVTPSNASSAASRAERASTGWVPDAQRATPAAGA
jgi:hypothetical protein